MSTRQTGVRFIILGEIWRNAFISGKTITEIAKETNQNPQTVSRAIWLARIPLPIKELISNHPEIFTRTVLLDTFAAKRKQCEKEGFKKLACEVQKMLAQGKGAKPNLKRTNAKVLSKKPKLVKTNPTLNMNEAIQIEQEIRNKLKVHCRIAFNTKNQGEIRLFFTDRTELAEILKKIL